MGTERLLLELARLCPRTIPCPGGPLEEHDRERRSDLMRTLRLYLDAGANASEAADRLFLHRNSMLYRLTRVEKLTGLDLKDPRARLALQLGLLFVGEQERSTNYEIEHP